MRLCDWLDATLHFRLLQEWHFMPDCFDPDPQKRELSCLAINQKHFDLLSEHTQLRWLNHMSDVAQELKKSPKGSTYHHVRQAPVPQPRPWPTQLLDLSIIKLWPLVRKHHWSAAQLLSVLQNVLQPDALAPCSDEPSLVAYCNNTLSLRWSSIRQSSTSTQKSKFENQKSFSVALRLLEPRSPQVHDMDSSHQTKTE
jgi:hypothetical protein